MEVHIFHANSIGIEEIVLSFSVQAHLRAVRDRHSNNEAACFIASTKCDLAESDGFLKRSRITVPIPVDELNGPSLQESQRTISKDHMSEQAVIQQLG
jgi:hypothetical protein